MSEGPGRCDVGAGTGGYETFPVTADWGIRAWGRDPAEVFIQAARALWTFLVVPGSVRCEQMFPVQVEADDLETLLVAWLNEMLYLHEVQKFVAADFAIQGLTDTLVHGEVWGERLDPSRHVPAGHVKAVTYHQLQVVQTPRGWESRVVVDV
jgi:SHS2 domain-containing protein